jgi:hypothetical protein
MRPTLGGSLPPPNIRRGISMKYLDTLSIISAASQG